MITVRRKLTFNLGKYEGMEYEVTFTDIPDDTDPDAISVHLDKVFAPEVERAELASCHVPDENTSSVYTWNDITKEGANA